MKLTREELERYSRQTVLNLIGMKGQERLKEARVSVAGVGGLGCVSSLQLAAMGVGFIRITDQDVVDLSNLHRQYLYDTTVQGYPKVEIAQKRLKALNPNTEVEALPLTINRDTAEQVVKGVDVVVDGLDRFAPRYAINEACIKYNVPYIYGGALVSYGNVSTIIPGNTACLECFLGEASDETQLTCEVSGVFSPIVSIVASIQVREAVYLLLGKQPRLSNKLLLADVNILEFETFNVVKRADCKICGKPLAETDQITSEIKVAELCGKGSFMISPRVPLMLNLDQATNTIGNAFRIKIRAGFGLTFDYSEEISISLMKTGNMLIKGIENKETALEIYDRVITILGVASKLTNLPSA